MAKLNYTTQVAGTCRTRAGWKIDLLHRLTQRRMTDEIGCNCRLALAVEAIDAVRPLTEPNVRDRPERGRRLESGR